MVSEASLPNLLCREDESTLDEILDFDPEIDREFVEMLLLKETNFRGNAFAAGERDCLNHARSFAIRWILENRERFGYKHRTAYLSVIYLDLFLIRSFTVTDGKLWQISLLSNACLSLAAKMEEPETKALTKHRVDVNQFAGFTVQRMELMVLHALGWKMSHPTPFAYMNYFAMKFFNHFMHKELLDQASELVLAMMEEVNVGEHRPSIIAAAAVLTCYDSQLSKADVESKVETIPSWGSIEKEHTFSCYTIYKKNLLSKTPNSVLSCSSTPSIITNASAPTSRYAFKRKVDFADDGYGNCGRAMKVSKT